MRENADSRCGSYGDERAALVVSLRAQRPGLDETIHTHVRDAVPAPLGSQNVEYEAGQYAAIAEAVDYGLSGIEYGESWSGPVPPATIAQARRAARDGVPLDAVLRRYHAGQAKLADMIIEQAEHSSLSSQPNALRLILSSQATLLDYLTAQIATEYMRESTVVTRSREQHRAERVQRLLVGAAFDTSGLDYEFDRFWHICVIAVGVRAEQALGTLATQLDRQLLPVPRGREIVWGWLGGLRRIPIAEVERVLAREAPGVTLALGEPGRGIEGWRLTHRQAQAALPVALLERQTLTRYADVALLAPWMSDYTLAQSFVDIHLSPLDEQTDSGAVARETLRAYFEAGHQVAAAAAALKVDRGTLRKRLTSIEHRLGYALCARQAELEVALRLESLYGAQAGAVTPSLARGLSAHSA
jgi:hypothetical protein